MSSGLVLVPLVLRICSLVPGFARYWLVPVTKLVVLVVVVTVKVLVARLEMIRWLAGKAWLVGVGWLIGKTWSIQAGLLIGKVIAVQLEWLIGKTVLVEVLALSWV